MIQEAPEKKEIKLNQEYLLGPAFVVQKISIAWALRRTKFEKGNQMRFHIMSNPEGYNFEEISLLLGSVTSLNL